MTNSTNDAKTKGKRSNVFVSLAKNIVKDRSFGLVIACVILVILAVWLTPTLMTGSAINGMLRNNAIFGIMSIGMLMVLVTRGIDLSIAATMVFSGLIIAIINADYPDVPIIVLVLLSIAMGTVIGMYNGFLVSKLKLLPIIVTLSTLYVVRGMAFIFSDSRWIVPGNFSDSYKAFASGNILGINNLVVLAAVMFIVFYVILAHFGFGRRVYAVGSSPHSARVTGINNDRIIFAVYTIMGAIAGFAGFLYTANYAIAQSTMAMGMEMDVIAICILGGVSINGGTGRISGIIIATLLFALISSFLSMLPGLSIWTDAIKGAIIVGAVILNIYTTRSANRQALKQRNI